MHFTLFSIFVQKYFIECNNSGDKCFEMHDRFTPFNTAKLMESTAPKNVMFEVNGCSFNELAGEFFKDELRMDALDQHGHELFTDLLDLLRSSVDQGVAADGPQLSFPFRHERHLVFHILVFVLVLTAALDHHHSPPQVSTRTARYFVGYFLVNEDVPLFLTNLQQDATDGGIVE